jgi:uncharacterized membrane protein
MKKATKPQQVEHAVGKPVNNSESKGQLIAVKHEFSGPLPDPNTFRLYEEILPGSAERILALSEAHARHGMDLEKSALNAQITIEQDNTVTVRRGQNFGMYSTVLMTGVAILALLTGQPWVAATICSTTIIGLAAVFVTGKIRNKVSGQP